jgi:hypothetical protein
MVRVVQTYKVARINKRTKEHKRAMGKRGRA